MSSNKMREIPKKIKPHENEILSIFKMQPLSQETLSLQEQVLFCFDAGGPCKDSEVIVFMLAQTQIAFFFFFLSASIYRCSLCDGPCAEAECFCKATACVNTHAGSWCSVICQAAPYLFFSALLEKTRQQLRSKVEAAWFRWRVSGIASPYMVSEGETNRLELGQINSGSMLSTQIEQNDSFWD